MSLTGLNRFVIRMEAIGNTSVMRILVPGVGAFTKTG